MFLPLGINRGVLGVSPSVIVSNLTPNGDGGDEKSVAR